MKEDYKAILQKLMDSGNLVYVEEIDNITGANTENDAQNKLFIWQFEKEDAKRLIDVYTHFSSKNINSKTLQKLKNDLIKEGKEIEKKGVYPIEVILYTSKVINNRLKDISLLELLSEVIGYFISRDNISAVKTLKHIIKNWTWVEQLKIAILSLSFIDEFELLSLIYDEYRSDISLKYEVFRALLNSKNDKCIEMILNIISYLDSDYEADRRIGNVFKDKYDIYYPLEGLQRAKELYNSDVNISKFGRKTLQKLVDIDVNKIDGKEFELGKMIDLAKKDFINNKNIFEKAFLEGGKNRDASITSMSYSKDKSEVVELLYNLYLENKKELSIYECMKISITLALSNSEKSLNICKDNRYDLRFKPYEYACKFLLGDEYAAELLARELIMGKYCKDNKLTMKAVRPCLFKNLLPKKIEEVFSELINSCTENEMSNYLVNIKSFLRNNKKSPGMVIELQKICGYKSKDERAYKLFKKSEKLQKVFMNVMVDLVNLDTISIYEKMMFNIANDNSLSQETRIKARNIVSELVDVAPPSI